MMISVMKNNHPVDVLQVSEQFVHFSVYDDDGDDYVEQTSQLMQRFAEQLFKYPMYIHFEGYEWDIDDIRKDSEFDVAYKPSGRKVLTMSGLKMYRAEIPAYTVKVQHEHELRTVFEKWFHLGMENGFPIVVGENIHILTVEHDAQGISFITNDTKWIKQDVLENYIDERLK